MEFKEGLSANTIIPGYESIFDRMSSNTDSDLENTRRQYADASKKLWDSGTIADLYSAMSGFISLPTTDDETVMKSNLLNLALAVGRIPLADQRVEVEHAIELIEHRMVPRLNTLLSGPQPKLGD